MDRSVAERFARERLAFLASQYEEGANADWNALALAARAVLAGDYSAAATFRRVFDEPGFAVSNSCTELGYAALGLALCGESVPRDRSMRINGIDACFEAAYKIIGLQ